MSKATEPSQTSRRFAWITCLVVAACAAGIAVMLTTGPDWDRALANVGVLIFGFVALMAILAWFTFGSGFADPIRWTPAIVIGAGLGLFFLLFEFIGLSGVGIPRFRWRFAPAPHELLADELRRTGEEVSLQSAHEEHFFQFLGPHRNQRIDTVRLDPEWSSRPPRELWRQPCGAGWSSFVAVGDFCVTLEQRGELEVVTCYDIKTGAMQWWHAIEQSHQSFEGGLGPYSTPTIHEGRVYALGGTGVLRCLDGADGRLLWRRDLLDDFGVADSDEDKQEIKWGRAASPLIVDDVVVVPAGGPPEGPYVSLAAYQLEDGKLAWTSGDQQIGYSSPIETTLAGVRQILIINQETISAHAVEGHAVEGDGGTRRVLWTHPWPGDSSMDANVSQPVVVDGDRVLLTKAYGQGAELLKISRDARGRFDVETLWKNESVLKTKLTSAVVHHSFVYALSDGIMECVKLANGQRQWKRGRYEHGQILLVGELLLVVAESGQLVLVRPDSQQLEELASIEALDGQTWNNPCLSGRYLLLRNSREAVCYELSVRE